MIRPHSIAIAPLILFAAATGAQPPPVRAASAVPNPIVIGPIPAIVVPGDASRGYPFFSTIADLESQGYVEEEYFFEGTANQYTSVTPLDTATVIDSGHSYRTRMVVRRPLSPQRFNGTVVMEWQNRATRYDLDAMWAVTHPHLMRRGYAWVGVSAFRASVHTPGTGLKAWNPSRYGTLDVPIVAGNAPEIQIATIGDPTSIVRDSTGNALGGIRLPEHAVPTAVNTGLNGPATNFCRAFGSHVPFDQSTLDALYANHGTYVSRVAQAAQENVAQGFIVPEDAEAAIAAAADSVIGRY